MTDVSAAVARIREWGERRDWCGYDPYDALNSRFAPVLTAGTPLGRRLLTQAVKLSPLNLRPLLAIAPAWNAKAIGLVASGYARLAAAGQGSAEAPARRWLDWLAANREGDAWGYHFDVQTRFFFYPRGTPNTIATSFAINGLLDGWALLGHEPYLRAAEDGASFLVREMLERADEPFFRYLPEDHQLIHNANLLACAAVARAVRLGADDALLEGVPQCVGTTIRRQNADGSWSYAEGSGRDWIDNFHTGYVLDGLAECSALVADGDEALDRGVEFWQSSLFLADGTPRYSTASTLPLDAHCYATAIDTWVALAHRRTDARARAERTADLLIRRMLARDGHVEFQRRRFVTLRVPFVRWTAAPSFRALAGLLQLGSKEGNARLD